MRMISIRKYMIILSCVVLLALALFGCGQPQSTSGSKAPIIMSLTAMQNQTTPGGTVIIESKVVDPDNNPITYKWSATGGSFGGSGANNIWQAPSQNGVYEITLTVENGKGGFAQAKVPITVTSNRPPAIVSLTADPQNVVLGGSTTLTCTANDPDGDILRYSWIASEGGLNGSGNKVSWVAPSKSGDFGITCVVADGKGGEARQEVVVKVGPSTGTITIKLLQPESGTVSSSGEKDITRYRAGDDANNAVYRAFFSYDIFGLNKSNIRLAKLRFSPANIMGDPFNASTGLSGLRLWRVKYGAGLPDFNITGDNLFYASALLTSPPSEIEVTPELTSLVAAGADRFQVEALFYKPTNGQQATDMIEWTDVVLVVTFAPQ